jgi:hypothetical protein
MPNEVVEGLSTKDFDAALQSAHSLYRAGNSDGAIAIIEQTAQRKSLPEALRRRLFSAWGGFLCDAGRWRESAEKLDQAKALAQQIGEQIGIEAVNLNYSSLLIAQSKHSAVLALTASTRLSADDNDILHQIKSGLLANRACSALALRAGSIAVAAAGEAFDPKHRQRNSDSLIVTNAGMYLVRGLLLAKKTAEAQTTCTTLESLLTTGRSSIYARLARAAIAGETGNSHLARSIAEEVLKSNAAQGLKRDAWSILLRTEQNAGNAAGVLAALEQMADYAVKHRVAQLREFAIGEEAIPAIHRLSDTATPSTTFDTRKTFDRIAKIIEASEPRDRFTERRAIATLAYQFALFIGFGTHYAHAIFEGAIARDFGSFGHVWEPGAGALSRRIYEREAVRATLRLFKAIGVPETSTHYLIAAEAFERFDGEGAGAVKAYGNALSREAQVVNLCAAFASHLRVLGTSKLATDSFLKNGPSMRNRRVQAELFDQFAGWLSVRACEAATGRESLQSLADLAFEPLIDHESDSLSTL